MGRAPAESELLPGTLNLLILETLRAGPRRGYGIARHIRQRTEEVLRVEEGSLYPALQRLLQGWVTAAWRMSETKRRARYYALTAAGRKQLGIEASSLERMVAAIGRVLRPV
ncbi:MAG: PadR family transcriptional regulator [Terriglobales bacterium]